jgi:hypothetical protein
MATTTDSVPDRGNILMVQIWVLTVVASITVVLRFVFRAQKSIIGWDDLFTLLSTVSNRPQILISSRLLTQAGLLLWMDYRSHSSLSQGGRTAY